ncbi:hypothetical protein D3C80_1764710 [compost metagenome]
MHKPPGQDNVLVCNVIVLAPAVPFAVVLPSIAELEARVSLLAICRASFLAVWDAFKSSCSFSQETSTNAMVNSILVNFKNFFIFLILRLVND